MRRILAQFEKATNVVRIFSRTFAIFVESAEAMKTPLEVSGVRDPQALFILTIEILVPPNRFEARQLHNTLDGDSSKLLLRWNEPRQDGKPSCFKAATMQTIVDLNARVKKARNQLKYAGQRSINNSPLR